MLKATLSSLEEQECSQELCSLVHVTNIAVETSALPYPEKVFNNSKGFKPTEVITTDVHLQVQLPGLRLRVKVICSQKVVLFP